MEAKKIENFDLFSLRANFAQKSNFTIQKSSKPVQNFSLACLSHEEAIHAKKSSTSREKMKTRFHKFLSKLSFDASHVFFMLTKPHNAFTYDFSSS